MPKQTVTKETPLAELTLRRYEKPYDLHKRELVKKLCLSLGLLNPGDSRDIIVDILYVLLEARKAGKSYTSIEVTEKVIEKRKQDKLKLHGVANSNVRRQLARLKKLYLIDRQKKRYQIAESGLLTEAFSEKIEHFVLPSIIARVNDYLKSVDDEFS
jgi:hypothetical protein